MPPPKRFSSTPHWLLGVYLCIWIALAVAPLYREDWLLENMLVVIALPLLIHTARRWRYTDGVYVCLFAFFVLHAVGAHYTYSEVPYDAWAHQLTGHSLNELLGWNRNHYDRFVHLAYGLLITPACVELFDRVAPPRGLWRAVLPILFVMSHSALYEMIESAAAFIFGGDLGQAYLGTQGDVWDAQKDTALAAIGAVTSMLVMWLWKRRQRVARGAATLVTALAPLLLAGCSSWPLHGMPLARTNPAGGYRLMNLTEARRRDDLLVVLTFSGGGARATALSYGVLQALRDDHVQHDGGRKRLLDEIDMISAVSGGSVTAAYFALYGDGIFENFERDFLQRDVGDELLSRMINPVNLVRLASHRFARGDLIAEYLDDRLFLRSTFGDLGARADRPFVIINATDITTGTRFEFTQDRFDLLCADLDRYPIARAVAASSAAPIIATPIALRNYASTCGDHSVARSTAVYLHLVDGAVSDNLGIRAAIDAMTAAGDVQQLYARYRLGPLKRVALITVNAEGASGSEIANHARAPPELEIVRLSAVATIDSYSRESEALLRDLLSKWAAAAVGGIAPTLHHVEVKLAALKDPPRRARLLTIPTTLALRAGEAHELACAGQDLLRASAAYRELLRELDGEISANAPCR
jgi:uncharacterized membrane protein YjdF/predicted acylesterase/phospholipase RssA